MKKSLILNLVLSSLVYAYVNPLPLTSRSTENGGTLSAIDAYQDGVGAMVIQQGRGVDNSTMNALVFKYGNEAKNNTLTVGDQVLLSGTAEDKLLAGKLFADGVACNDNNPVTSGETYLNGVCQGGTIANGTTCDDNNALTYGDAYTNEICAGQFAYTCNSIHQANPSLSDGIYTIDPDGTGGSLPYSVLCDMTTSGGGWTLIANSATTSISYLNTAQTNINTNFNITTFPNISTSDKLVKTNGTNSFGIFTSTTSNSFTNGTQVLNRNSTYYTNIRLFNLLNIKYTSASSFGLLPYNHGSICSTADLQMMMLPFSSVIGGVHGGTQLNQGGCDDSVNWKDNFSWQVYSK